MRISERGLALIRRFEGLRLGAYRCQAGVWTVGYGHTGAEVVAGLAVTRERAEELLREDCARFERAVEQLVTCHLTQSRFDALVSFAFNVGERGFGRSGLLRRINADPADAAVRREFLKWNKAGGVVSPSLSRRRTAEAELYFSGE
jgi:lysozyme